MSQFRKIKETTVGRVTLKCFYDRDWQEYQVRAYIDGKCNKEATYFTDDKQDALDTMNTTAISLSGYIANDDQDSLEKLCVELNDSFSCKEPNLSDTDREAIIAAFDRIREAINEIELITPSTAPKNN
ncbi:hypothetical protein C4J81_10365 [Deltaproteobacteria bacterium Smac51]|nr:hypothetical protein C4J81_10365 [Deltaproteobacteria bacterium Smac51]